MDTRRHDEPEAHALYDRMTQVTSKAASLFYESRFDWQSGAKPMGMWTYRLWLRKRPFGVRVEVHREGALTGVLVGDRQQFGGFVGEDSNVYDFMLHQSYKDQLAPRPITLLGYNYVLSTSDIFPLFKNEWPTFRPAGKQT